MQSNVRSKSDVKFKMLSEKQVKEIHSATLKLLEKTGVEVLEEESLNLLKNAGAKISENRVRIPAKLVEDALKSVPKEVILWSRDGKSSITLGGNNIYFGTGSDCPSILDYKTGERRRFIKDDVSKAAILCDYLPNIDFFMSLGLVSDVPNATSDRHQFEAMVLNTKKPIVFTAHDVDGMTDIINMASVAVGGRENLRKKPSICLYAEPVTPLRHIGIATKKLLLAAEEGIPVIYTPCPSSGATAPATMAGTLLLSVAESLSGLVISQLKKKGALFIMGGVITIMDMATTLYCYGAPEFHLLSAALTDMAHYYRLPMFSTAGCSDSKTLDQQAAIESSLSCLMAALSGANLIHDVGYLESGLMGSYEMVVMSNEIIGTVKRIIRGVEVNKDTLAVDLIDKVGPGGNFLTEEHTVQNFRKEQWFPQLINRQNYDSWIKAGKKPMGDKIKEKINQIFSEHKPEQLSSTQKEKIHQIITDREKK